jgi:hypothetical protein
MVKFTLKKWPFEQGERVALHWMRSPIKTKQNRWIFELVFKNKVGELIPYTVPWGTLPNFRLGQIFQDGKALDSPIRGFNTPLHIPDMSECEIKKAINIPPKLYFLENSNNWEEKCLIYKNDSQTIIVPCIEIIRSILTPMKILANALVRPQGLDDLIDSRKIEDETLFLNLSSNVPSNIISNDFVSQLSWLLYEENVREIWDDVYQNVFNAEKINNSGIPIKLATKMPLVGSRNIRARVLKQDNIILVLELSYIPGLKRQYNKISVSHHSFIERVVISNPGPKKSRKSKTNDNSEPYYLVDTGAPKNRSEQVLIDSDSTVLGFDEPIEIVREKHKQRLMRHHGEELETPKIPGSEENKKEKLLSTAEPEADGDLMPAEFRPEFIKVTSELTGLENFLKAVDLVKYIVKHIIINIDIEEMPRKGTYPFLPNGSLRKYALVKFEKPGYETSYLLEIGRPDNKCLYTLVFKPKGQPLSKQQLEILVNNLIDVLIDNNGCWEKDYLIRNKEVRFIKMRHVTNRPPTKWAENIVEKLGYDVE